MNRFQTVDLYPPRGKRRNPSLTLPAFDDDPVSLLRRLGFPVVAALVVSCFSALAGFWLGAVSHEPVVVEVQPVFDGFSTLPPLQTGLTEAQAWHLYRFGSLKDWQTLRPEEQIAVCRCAVLEYNPNFSERQIRRRSGAYAVGLNTMKIWDLNIAESVGALDETFGERLDR